MKKCNKCGEVKKSCDFPKAMIAKDGLSGVCSECKRKRQADYYRKNRAHIDAQHRLLSKPTTEAYREAKRRYAKKNPEKYTARMRYRSALFSGKIKKEPCSVCGSWWRPNAHHKDYSKPMDITWLCFECHLLEHGKKLGGYNGQG